MSMLIARRFVKVVLASLMFVPFMAGSAAAQTVQVTTATFDAKVLEAEGLVVVDFTADWCPPCRRQTPVLERLARNQRTITVAQVDVDLNPELADEYRISSLPTLMFFYNGHYLGQVRGFQSYEELTAIVLNMLRTAREIRTRR